MGRKRISMELIRDEKTRRHTYETRKTSLMKKAFELTTLCDVNACVIIYGEDKPEIWPSDPEQVRCVLSDYKEKHRIEQDRYGGTKRSRTSSLSSFLEEKNKCVEEEIQKSRKRKREAKYPSWFGFMDGFSEAELRKLAMSLENKIKATKRKLELIKAGRLVNKTENTTFDLPVVYPILQQHESMMELLMRDNTYDDHPLCLSVENELFEPLTIWESCSEDSTMETMTSFNPSPLPLMFY